ncbi:MAG: sigma 54-interacting transcriptional regulator [Myxococcales bacterium]|nr:sigma 54-interacting transcriptional regulator [Myxococcales bacterium]MCB9737362.1 sigma 54-interacting transcriptional regulator [Deltaproteobacteria bacterium]
MRSEDVDILVAEAIGAVAGPALVLDADLRVRFASDEAAAVLGSRVPIGASAPALLCGDRKERPVAEALAAGQAVQAVIPRLGVAVAPGEDARACVHVRSLPLRHDDRVVGWLLFLSAAPDSSDGPELFHGLWSRDPRMKRLFRTIERVAQDDVPVLVRGETGAGKELVAAAIHAASPRQSGPFRAINCAALPGNLLESELFGHARGAFTGAVKDTPGHIQLAHRGTLFLDEVAEVPLELQAKLLRVLETRQVVPVGGREPISVDVRIVSATHRGLRKEVEEGRFRGDLMYRLRVIPLFLPPLRDRVWDVELLVDRFIAEMNPGKRRKIERVSPAAMRALERHDWPGNVRELRNVLAYAYAIGDGPQLELAHLPPELTDAERAPVVEIGRGAREEVADAPENATVVRIRNALARTNGNREQAARLLGWSRVTLWRRMRELGI